jgi:hypothetical protein
MSRISKGALRRAHKAANSTTLSYSHHNLELQQRILKVQIEIGYAVRAKREGREMTMAEVEAAQREVATAVKKMTRKHYRLLGVNNKYTFIKRSGSGASECARRIAQGLA